MHLLRGRMAVLSAFALIAASVPLLASSATAAPDNDNPWTPINGAPPAVSASGNPAEVDAARLAAFTLDTAGLRGDLPAKTAGIARLATPARVVTLPSPDGSLQRFQLSDSPVMEAGLAARHPEISTYAGRGLDDTTATIRADLTPLGFHASVRSAHGDWYIDPFYHAETTTYASYYGLDLAAPSSGLQEPEEMAQELQDDVGAAAVPTGPDVNLRTYRLALVTDPSYATFFGAQNVTAAKVTLINRVTQIYEDETAIRLILIDDTDKTNLNTPELATGANGPCGAAACFTAAQLTSCAGATLTRNRIVLGQLVGASNYDIGHIGLGVNGGGVASLGVVGGNNKAQGCTGLPTPVGDFYAVDYVAHEMGHEFGGNHTFNGNQLNCSGGNRNGGTSVEPGSGSSVMAYAGICRQDDLQPHSDPYWSQRSYTEITTYTSSTRPAINEVQTVSLYGFDTDGDSFTLSHNGSESAPIVRGVNYTTAGIKAAIEAIPGWPAGGIATVAAFGNTGALNDTGFQVTFTGTLAATNVSALSLTSVSGTEGFVGETAKGGAIDNGGFSVTPTGNHAPVVTVPSPSYTIPLRTPFALTGSATDSDGDTVTYMWEQNDRGGTAGTALVNNTKTNGPLFRQFGTAAIVSSDDTLKYHSPGENAVSTDPNRVFPDLAQIVAGNTNAATGACPAAPPPPTSGGTNVPRDLIDCYSEFLPTADWVGQPGDRTLHFRLTARDGHPGGGGVGSADVALVLAPTADPFLVTSQSAPSTVNGAATQTVTWDVAGTDAAPVNTSSVKITFSADGGKTFPYVLAESTPNDGSASVTIPNIATRAARIKIEAVGNVFFDINDADIAVTPTADVSYTGDARAFAVGSGATVQLRATLQDRSLVPGDIRTATVSFTEGGTTLCSATVVLLGAGTTDGSAGCTAVLATGAHTVTVVVGGGYAGGATATVPVTAYNGNFLTGSGTLTPASGAGSYPASGSVSWATDAKINAGAALAGSATVTFQSGGRSYRINGSLIGLGVNGAAAQSRYAATLVDVTGTPVTVANGLTLALTATDQGSPGRGDTLALTLWNGDALLFSTNWTGVATAESTITGGNLTIH